MTMNWKTHKFTWSSSSFHPGRIFLKNPAGWDYFMSPIKTFIKILRLFFFQQTSAILTINRSFVIAGTMTMRTFFHH